MAFPGIAFDEVRLMSHNYYVAEIGASRISDGPAMGFLSVNGVQLDVLFLGLGVGYMMFPLRFEETVYDVRAVPFTADMKVEYGGYDERIKSLFFASFGYHHPVRTNLVEGGLSSFYPTGGFRWDLGVGIRIHPTDLFGMDIGLAWSGRKFGRRGNGAVNRADYLGLQAGFFLRSKDMHTSYWDKSPPKGAF